MSLRRAQFQAVVHCAEGERDGADLFLGKQYLGQADHPHREIEQNSDVEVGCLTPWGRGGSRLPPTEAGGSEGLKPAEEDDR